MKRLLALLISSLGLLVACGSGGGPSQPPPPPPPPPSEGDVLLSATSTADWGLDSDPSWPQGWRLRDGAFTVRDSATADLNPPYACHTRGGRGHAWTTRRIDFTPYQGRDVRLRFRRRARCGGVFGILAVRIKSNVPGTPDLAVIDDEHFEDDACQAGQVAFERVYDLSLQNALAFHEATVDLYLIWHVDYISRSHAPCGPPVWAELDSLRIVAKRP